LEQLASSLGGLTAGFGSVLAKGMDVPSLSAELALYRLREPLTVSPDRKLDAYISLLHNVGRPNPAQLKQAAQEAAALVAESANATPEARAKALFVLGLANRDLGAFEPARKSLAEALKAAGGLKDAAWTKEVAAVLKELTDPAAYFIPRAEKLAAAGDLKASEEVVNNGLKALPDNPRLLMLRALTRIEGARGDRNRIAAVAPQVRQDAQAAAADPGAAGDAAYAVGLLEEELGNFAAAEAAYRQAINAHRGNADDVSRYIVALARVLQRDRAAAPAAVAPVAPKNVVPAQPEKNETKQPDETGAKQFNDVSSRAIFSLVVLTLVGIELDDENDLDPATAGRVQESLELANKLIQSNNAKIRGQGYMIRGQALFKLGKQTEGVREYAKGLELAFPGAPSRDLARMLQEHPGFEQPDSTAVNPVLADQAFSKGLDLYWSRRYPEAENQFKKAVQLHNQDARFHYYLGMSLLSQPGKSRRDVQFAFEQAAKLEAANRPSTGEVNGSLERIQGPLRTYVDSFRKKSVAVY
jgi:tetratricopeptide (TPR) repeat protein